MGVHSGTECGYHAVLVGLGELVVQGKDDGAFLGVLAVTEALALTPGTGAAVLARPARPRLLCVSGLAVRTHDPSPGGHSRVEHRLHDLTLPRAVREIHAVALPVRAGPRGLFGREHTR